MTYDELRSKIEQVVDPGFNRTFKEVNGIKKLVVGPTGVAELEIYLKDKSKYEQQMKIQIINSLKSNLDFQGLRLIFLNQNLSPLVKNQLNIWR